MDGIIREDGIIFAGIIREDKVINDWNRRNLKVAPVEENMKEPSRLLIERTS